MRQKREIMADECVHKVCKLIKKGLSNKEIADIVDVSSASVSQIRRGRTYKHITSQYQMRLMHMKEEQVHEICRLLEDGISNKKRHLSFSLNATLIIG